MNETQVSESTMDETLKATSGNTNSHSKSDSVERRLSESLDIEITVDEVEELKNHLQGCPPCLEFMESLKTTVKLCHEVGIDEMPPPLSTDTRERMVEAYTRMLEKRRAGH